MIEETLRDYLGGALDVPVRMERPTPPPERLCLLERVGGGQQDTVYRSMFAVTVSAPTLYETVQLHEQARDAMLGADALAAVSRAALNTEYNDTDTAEKRYQYTAVYEITHY